MANYRYQQNVDVQARFTRISLKLDNGLTALIELGKTYDLTANEVLRASQYIMLVPSSDSTQQPFQKVELPVVGTLDDGDVPSWNSAISAFVPSVGGGGGGIVGPITEDELDATVVAKLNARATPSRVALGTASAPVNSGASQTITLNSGDDGGLIGAYLTLTANATLVIVGLGSVTEATGRVKVTQDATGGHSFTVQNGVGGPTYSVAVDTTAGASGFVYWYTDDGTNLIPVGPATGGGGGTSLPTNTKLGDRLVIGSTGAAAWEPPSSPVSALDLPSYGVRIFHRGSGYLAEDDSLRGMRMATKLYSDACDVVDGGDWRLNADGSIVVMHDSTTGRTCTTSVTVSAQTDSQWRALRLKARTPAVPTTEPPPFASDVLAQCKRLGVVCAPELKLTGNSAFNSAAVALIQSYGMEKQCIVGSAVLGDLAVFKAAGIPTMYIVNDTSDTQANILAAAPDFFCFNYNVATPISDSLLQAINGAGIKVGTWMIDSRKSLANVVARLDGLGVLLNHYYSDDHLWVSNVGTFPTKTHDPFAQGRPWPGMVLGQPLNDPFTTTIDIAGVSRTFVGSPYRLGLMDPDNSATVLQSWMAPAVSATSSITVSITFDAVGTNTARWVAIRFNCPDDTPQWAGFTTANKRGQGYQVLLRVTGSLELYKLLGDGATATALGSTQATAAITTGQTVTLKIEPNLATNQLRVTRTDSGGFPAITATDATYRPAAPYVWFEKLCNTGEGFKVSFSNVVVVP